MNGSRNKKPGATSSVKPRVQPETRTQGQPQTQDSVQPRQPRERRFLHSIYWLLATAIFGVDQLSKIVAQGRLSEGPIEILPILNFSLAYNRGAAFGVFSDGQMSALLLAVSAVATTAFAVLLHRESRALPCLAWSLLLGGALGNGLDRLLFDRVTDFIDFHILGHHFPAFNIADASLTFGVFLMIVSWYRQRDKKQTAQEPPSSSSRREKRAPTESMEAVSEPAPQAGKGKSPIDRQRVSAAEGRGEVRIRSHVDLPQTSTESANKRPAESPPSAPEQTEACATNPIVEAGKNRQSASAAAPTRVPAPFAPLAEADLSQAFSAESFSAESQQEHAQYQEVKAQQ